MTSEEAGAVRQALDAVRSRWHTLAMLRLARTVAAIVATVWLLAWVAVRGLALGGGALALAAAIAFAVSTSIATAAIVRRQRAPRDRALARYIEEQCPALEDRLATAVEIAGDQTSAGGRLRGALLADASRALGEAPLDDIVPRERVRRAGVFAAVATFAVLAAVALWIEPGRQALRSAAFYAIPGRLVLQVSPGDARVKRGAPFVVRVQTTAGQAGIVPELTVKIGDQRRTVRMPASGRETFAWRFDGVPASFTYSVSAAGRTSETYTVTALDPPRVVRIDLRYEFPEYTRLPPRDEEDGGDIYAPNGTRVTLSIRASTGATAGALALGDGRRVPLQPASGGTFQTTLPIIADGSYRVALTDRDGLAPDADTEYLIHVLNDRPPDVRILRPAGDRQVTPLEEITIEARADDDYGVGAFDLVYSVRGSREKVGSPAGRAIAVVGHRAAHAVPRGSRRSARRLRHLLRPGARCRPRPAVDRGKKRHLLPGGEAVRGGVRGGAEPGWRRGGESVAGRPRHRSEGHRRGDLEAGSPCRGGAIGAGRAGDRPGAGRVEGSRRSRAPPSCVRRGAGRAWCRATAIGPVADGPLTSAGAAMERAKSALDAVKTADALPPEMEALNHLLRAQAEIKKREVIRGSRPTAPAPADRIARSRISPPCSIGSCSGSSRRTTKRRRAPRSGRTARRTVPSTRCASWHDARSSSPASRKTSPAIGSASAPTN